MVEAAFAALVVALAVVEAVAALGAPLGSAPLALTLLLAALFAGRAARGVPAARPARRDLAAAIVLCAWPLAVWARLAVLAVRRPVYDWDGLYYHLPALHGWVQAGRVAWLDHVPDLPFANGYPGGAEVLSFVVHLVTGSSAFVDGVNLLAWPLGALALAVVAGRLGLRGPWRWLPVALAAGTPALIAYGATCYTDGVFAAAVAAALAAVLLFAHAPEVRLRTRAVVLGSALGLVLATKGTGLPYAAVLGAAAVVLGWRRCGRRVAPAAAAAAAIALLVGGSWYARNLAHTGNPIFPVGLWLGDHALIDGWRPRDLVDPNLPPYAAGWPRLLWPLRCWLAGDGLGWLWLAAGLPAAAWAAGRAVVRRAWDAPGLALVAAGALLLAVNPAPWWDRQTLWLHAVGLPCAALAAARLPRRAAVAAAVALVAVAVAQGERTLAREQALGRTTTGYQSTWVRYFPDVPTAPGFDRAMAAPVIARSDWSRLGGLVGGALCLPLEARRILHVTRWADDAEVARLRRNGVVWIIWDRLAAGEPPAAVVAAAAERHRHHPAADLDLEALRIAP